MTREEAIDLLDNLIGMVEDNHNSNYDTALQMAIKALEQEPCKDLLDLCIIFAHQIEDQEQTIEELRTELKYRKNENKNLQSCLKIAENDYKKCYAENIRLAEKIRENII